jgi:SAM-dependent methyltransferase
MCASPYSKTFYESIADGARRSGEVIVPIIEELFAPRSIIDVGCGTGGFLATFARRGVDILGLDGEWASLDTLEIPRDCFRHVDLRHVIKLERRFDFAMCLEVAEHLPSNSAQQLVNSLTALAPAVLFSAAIPNQGGTDHINEQWPEYWAERFAAVGYVTIDCVRPRIWDDPRVEYWYAQNALVYVSPETLDQSPRLQELAAETSAGRLNIVHPRQYLDIVAAMQRAYTPTGSGRLRRAGRRIRGWADESRGVSTRR